MTPTHDAAPGNFSAFTPLIGTASAFLALLGTAIALGGAAMMTMM